MRLLILTSLILNADAFLDEDSPPDLFELSKYSGPGNDGGFRIQPRCLCLSEICYYPAAPGWGDIHEIRNETSSLYEVRCDCELGAPCGISYFHITFDVSHLYRKEPVTNPPEESVDTTGWHTELYRISKARSRRGHSELYRPVISDDEVSPARVTLCVLLRSSENIGKEDPNCTYL